MSNKRIAIITSGGDAPGMNAAIRAIFLAAQQKNITCIGFYNGYNGIIEQRSKELNIYDVNGIIHRGGTILKSARCAEMLTTQGVKQAASTLYKEKIDALIVIGGDGSFKGLLALQNHWQGQVIGIPGTIDNDIDGTDFTIGFSTAVNTGIDAVDKIRDTADAFERIFIVELMGRNSGHITYNVGIATGAEQILSFENCKPSQEAVKTQQLINNIKQAKIERQSSYIIVIAENLWSGGSTMLANTLQEHGGVESTVCVLGYIQRGGSPVAKDRTLATKMGVGAIKAFLNNESNIMIAEINNQMKTIPLAIAIKHQKRVHQSLVNAHENILHITEQDQV